MKARLDQLNQLGHQVHQLDKLNDLHLDPDEVMASETGIPGEMKGCKELVQEGMQVRKLELEGTLGETTAVGSLLWASIPNWDRKGCCGCSFQALYSTGIESISAFGIQSARAEAKSQSLTTG
jgi:hypothetical protein